MEVHVVRQDWLANWLLERFDVPDEERRKAILPDEQAMMVMMQMEAMKAAAQNAGAQQQSGGGSMKAISDGRTVGGSGGYTPSGRDKNEKLGLNVS